MLITMVYHFDLDKVDWTELNQVIFVEPTGNELPAYWSKAKFLRTNAKKKDVCRRISPRKSKITSSEEHPSPFLLLFSLSFTPFFALPVHDINKEKQFVARCPSHAQVSNTVSLSYTSSLHAARTKNSLPVSTVRPSNAHTRRRQSYRGTATTTKLEVQKVKVTVPGPRLPRLRHVHEQEGILARQSVCL